MGLQVVTAAAVALAVGTAALASAAPAPARASADRPDETGPYSVHVIYMVPQDAKDRKLDVDPGTRLALDGMQRWLSGAAGGLRWRFDTHRGGFDITYVRASQSTAAYADVFDIQSELVQRGFDQGRTKKRYLVLFDGATENPACGEAVYPVYGASAYAGLAPGPRLGGATAVVYMRSDPRCQVASRGTPGKPGHFQAAVLHELIHLEGVVSPASPHRCAESVPGGHVCTAGPLVFEPAVAALDPERRDVMFPAPTVPLSEKSLDAGNDDYYQALSRPGMINLETSAYLVGNNTAGTPLEPTRLLATRDHPR
jgi:hypothetical protein